jgi:two-component system, OmpR family, phosphate regulon sensor histidine kinase PhoR
VKLGIRSKLFLVSLGLIAASVVVADLYLTTTLDRLLTERVRADLLVRAQLVARDASITAAPLGDRRAWDALADELGARSQARVTVVDRDGAAIGDSEVSLADLARLESHAGRPEILEAVAKGEGVVVRDSATLRERMMYVAVPFWRRGAVAGVVRLATPLTHVRVAIAQLHRSLAVASLLAFGFAVLMSTVAAHLVSRSVRRLTASARAMAAGDLESRVRPSGGDEVAALGRALDQLAESLTTTLEQLRSERDLLGRILAGMNEGVLVLGPDGRVVLVNAALREMLLLDADAVGKPLVEVIRNAELNEVVERAVKAGSGHAEPVASEVELTGLRPRRLLVHAAPLRDEPQGVIAVVVDVTNLRRLESLRRDFVANVSHELRTPITAARSAAETLRAALGDPDAASRFVGIVERNIERLQQLVEDLLDLSRIEARDFRLQPEPLDLAPFIERVLESYRGRAAEKQIQLAATTSAGSITADPRALERALGNLVDNAVKYCPAGSRVTVTAERSEAGLRLAVEDTGEGIEPKHLPRLFERFYRVDSGRSRALGGTGLGLAIVKHLVEAAGGRVEVQSTVGRGTTFTIRLPEIRERPDDSS